MVRRVSGVAGLVGLVVAIAAAILGFSALSGLAFLEYVIIPWLAFIVHLNATKCLTVTEKAVWRRELWWSHRSLIAVWSYLFADDLASRTKGLVPRV